MADGSGQTLLDLGHELVVDLFAGGGGASLGIARAYRHPDVAVNHNPIAIAVHAANHPETEHFTCDVFEVDPVAATRGRPVGLLWASPDCRHHSKAKGGKPRNKKIRALAWVVVKWAAAVRPRVIHLENVEEFADWGPLQPDGAPCKVRKGFTFRRWVRQLERLGYVVEHRELVAADYGAPTIRKRLYVTARCDGRPIIWPKPTHHKTGAGGLPKWRAAAECIDFGLPAQSIFGRKRPLARNTLRRVAKGTWRYVLAAAEPFIIETANSSNMPVGEPLRTQCAQVKGGHFAVVAPALVTIGYGERPGQEPRCLDLQAPLGTVVAGGIKHALVAAHLTTLRGTSEAHLGGAGVNAPLGTVTGQGTHHALVSAFLSQASGGPNGHIAIGHDARSPMSTITGTGSHQQLVAAYLVKFYSCGGQWQGCDEPMHTVPTKDRMGLVRVVSVAADCLAPEIRARAKACADFLHEYLPEHFPDRVDLVLVGDYVLVDITLRMLVPRELARAQGFHDGYRLEVRVLTPRRKGPPVWRLTSKADQVRLIGNSVCPDVAEAIARESLADLTALYARHAA